jgi:hypothetical protein
MATVGEENTCLANICSRKHKHTSTNTQSQAHKLGHLPRDPTHIHRYTVFVCTHSRKKRQKKDGLLWLFLVAGGVGFLWVGLCFVVGKPLAARQCFLVGSLRWVFASPHVSPLRVGSRKPRFLADTMILLVDVSSLLLHLT